LDENGFAQRTAWVGADDGLLSFDRNGDGAINDSSELFGSSTEDGFSQLSLLDSNSDGVINALDIEFSNLTIWQDSNSNGITDEGELYTLSEAGITSIDLGATELSNETNNGNIVSHRSSVEFSDGSTGLIEDIWFQNDRLDSYKIVETDFNYSSQSALLPSLKGFGVVAGLTYAISENPALQQEALALVDQASTGNIIDFVNNFENFLFQWAGVADIDPQSRGTDIDARRVAVLEAFHGQDFIQPFYANDDNYSDDIVGPDAAILLNSYFTDVLESFAARFLLQSPLSQSLLNFYDEQTQEVDTTYGDLIDHLSTHPLISFAQIGYNAVDNSIAVDYQLLTEVTENLFSGSNSTPLDFSDAVYSIRLLKHDFVYDEDQYASFRDAVTAGLNLAGVENSLIEEVLSILDASAILRDGSGDDLLNGTSQDDILDTSQGDDILNGGYGSDTYIWGQGDGSDFIDEGGAYSTDADKLILNGLTSADVTLSRLNYELYVTINATGEVLTVDDHFYSSAYGLEGLLFADGEYLDRDGIQQAAWYRGTDSDDTLTGSSFGETLTGGLGDDLLRGGYGSDTYLWASGSGNDTINESGQYSTDQDVLRLTDLNLTDVSLSRVGTHLYITVTSTGDELFVDDQFYSSTYGVEFLEFADGQSLDRSDIQALSWFRGTDGNDNITGTSSDDTFASVLGDDRFVGGSGSDTYVWGAGYGNDSLYDTNGVSGDVDTLILEGLSASDVEFSRSGSFLNIENLTSGETFTVEYQFYNSAYGLEEIVFENGQTLNKQDIIDAAWYRGTDGNDTIYGGSASEVFGSEGGDDYYVGRNGSDTYIWGSGFGNDSVYETYGASGDIDRLILQDLNPDDISVARNGTFLTLTNLQTAETFTVNYQYYSDTYGLEEIEFANGTIWDDAYLDTII